jgi:hypothetical protein
VRLAAVDVPSGGDAKAACTGTIVVVEHEHQVPAGG